jgi:hypothetical protein
MEKGYQATKKNTMQRCAAKDLQAGHIAAHSDVGRPHELQSIAISHPLCKVRTMDGAQRVLFTLDLKVL